MAPSKAPSSWDDEDDSSTPPSSPPVIARRSKFDDEEEDGDVLESWDADEDSEEEREKAKKAAEAKARADAVLKANHKSVKQRIEEKQRQKEQQLEEESSDEDDEEEEDEATRLAIARQNEKDSDLQNAQDLFGGVGGVPETRSAPKPVTVQEDDDPTKTLDLSSLKLFNPTTLKQFNELRNTLASLLTAQAKKPHYASFVGELSKQLVKDMSSEQVRKTATGLSTISNEKMREEKAAEKGGKKTKAAKTKATLSANRDIAHRADTTAYDDGLADDDFM